MIKELKPNKYKNFKQTVVLKNQIDTVNGRLMINENTEASTRASHTFSIESSVQSWNTVKQRNIGIDSNNTSHEVAKSIVACSMITLEHTFELDTPIVANASVTLSLSGKSYKLPTNTHNWGDGDYNDAASAVEFIINHSQHTESTWSTNSEYIDYDTGKVPMFAWVKDAQYLIDYNTDYGYGYDGSNYVLEESVTNKLPPASNILTPWLTDAWSVYGTGFKATNAGDPVNAVNTGYWTQNDEKVRDKMMYPNPLPRYDWGSPFGGGSKPTSAYALTISFTPTYNYINASAKKIDAEGYRWRVTITIPRCYVYLAICRAAQIRPFNILSFNNGASDCPSLGFVDYIEEATINLVGEVLDEETEEFSQILDEEGNPVEGSKNHIKRLSNNELLTLSTSVLNLPDGKIVWQKLSQDVGSVINTSGNDYTLKASLIFLKSNKVYEDAKKSYEINALKAKVTTIGGEDFSPGSISNVQFVFEDNYDANHSSIEVTVTGSSFQVSVGDNAYVSIWGYHSNTFTGEWKDWSTKLLINEYEKGRIVINCDIEASYFLENGGLSINDLVAFKDIYNRWISRYHRVVLFEVKNIRKIFDSSKYVYQLTLIESNYGIYKADSITLIDYSNYTIVRNERYNFVLSFWNRRDRETGYFACINTSYFDEAIMDDWIDGNEYCVDLGIADYPRPVAVRQVDHVSVDFNNSSTIVTDTDWNDQDWYVEFVFYFSSQEVVTQAHLIQVVLNCSWPESYTYTEYHTPFLNSNVSESIDISTSGRAITTSESLGLDSGFIKVEDYDELNDCILFVVRCPIWAINNDPVDRTKPVLDVGELIESAGFYCRYDYHKQEVSSENFKTLGHVEELTSSSLLDINEENLIDSQDNQLVVGNNINYEGLYLVVMLKPNAAQMFQGIVPYIKQFSNKHLNNHTYAQGQYYHIKGANFESLDMVWDALTDSGELNNYHGVIYPLPNIPEGND